MYMLAVTTLTVSGDTIVALLVTFYTDRQGAKQMPGLNPQ